MAKELILTVGLPRSGKSTWAKKQNHPIVNPDSVRLAVHGNRFIPDAENLVWTISWYMAKSLLLAGHDYVIIDATNNTKKRRSFWKELADKMDCDIIYSPIPTSKEECIRRAKAENDEVIISVIERMDDEIEPITKEELGTVLNTIGKQEK